MSFFGSRRQAETPSSSAPQKPELPQPSSASQTAVGFETVLGANSSMEGTLSSGANIRLDGTFTGTLEITGNVLVGETAKITADINAKNISIAGAVRGNISGKKVQLLRTGRIWGDIRAVALTTEEGAFIDGKITMVPPQDKEAMMSDVPSSVDPGENEDVERIVPGVTPVGLGATEEDPDDMQHEGGEPPTGYAGKQDIENISQDEDLPAQSDSGSEGQPAEDPTEDEPDSGETKQST